MDVSQQQMDIMTMNLSGRFKGKEIQLLGERVVSTILQEKRVSLFFGQQTNFIPELDTNYRLVGQTKAFLVYDNNMYRGFDDKDFRDKLKDFQLLGKLPFDYLPYQNYAISKLQGRLDPSVEFIALSWVTDECMGAHRSSSLLKKLSTFMTNLAAIEEMPVVVAGTFRLTFEEACDILPDEISIFGYEATSPRRAMRAASFFLTTDNTGIYNLEPIPMSNIDFSMEHGPNDHWLNPEDAFYCDPVMATLGFNMLTDTDEEEDEEGAIGATSAKMLQNGSPDGGAANGHHGGRRASSYNNLYYDEDSLDGNMLCTIS